uniref:Putative beta-lactamase family protein n=1 Tax=Paulinella longichromatophora TaxID=1708747 RepID=A0A2H4ZQD8_9EUKA|nr:putative beta-lactamase family protein [Paulinella longichromatophora]
MSSSHSSSFELRDWKQPIYLLFRLLIIGIGCGVVTGTSLRIMSFKLAESSPRKSRLAVELIPNFGKISSLLYLSGTTKGFPLKDGQPRQKLLALNKKWSNLTRDRPELISSAFLLVLDDGRYAELNSNLALPANNFIKYPIALIVMNGLDDGSLIPDNSLEINSDNTYSPGKILGSTYKMKINEALPMMVRMNNYNATNKLIKYLGDRISINREFCRIGLNSTSIGHAFPDLRGQNTISTRDLVYIQSSIAIGKILGLNARDLFNDIMVTSLRLNISTGRRLQDLQRRKRINEKGLPTKGTTIYNKTDKCSITYAETGLIVLPNGQHVIANFIVKGPLNSTSSKHLIQDMIYASTSILLLES